MRLRKNFGYFVITTCIILATGCASYYTRMSKFQNHLYQGELQKAQKILEADKKSESNRNRLLHYLNKGYISWLLTNNQNSNAYFEVADRMIEDYINKPASVALSLVTNPSVKPYQPEDFEAVMLNYFKALNFIYLQDYEAAMVECRRINMRLNTLNDKFKDHQNKYQEDAFAHLVMGLLYDSDGDYNNAFIAYRNALNLYQGDYAKYFNMEVPLQLKKDLLRTAYLTGFYDEVRNYEKEFDITYEHQSDNSAELVFFWLNGLGPVKAEWSINFTSVRNEAGVLTLVNEEFGINYPIYLGGRNDEERSALENLRFLRVAFPKYNERLPVFDHAVVKTKDEQYPLMLAQNINEIAFKSLQDRMLREVGNSLARLATKKALEMLATEQDEALGAVVSITNALTEKADTRNWQTLPYAIHYSRIPLQNGENEVVLQTYGPNVQSEEVVYTINAKNKNTYFRYFHSLESYRP